uniref:Uncharacterized protein n=1 Tax=Rhodosorus marinus TaxID=101924 RepID=A0A7S2ZFY0_9RHOD|mmetsp:Transcript_18310/g.73403  ORF Transcript_18310/g.73403 Transcript_18310/m.73403 type:complete len:655 (+) Transcript_18310:243-2207(+)|eukprot:CAMPEP_0113971926 /NCGR_PEP_ID=MMETSP0011_2-20120614/12781_1 /TAXON_ID=101924 /ORGANISM="Rhodosorus marinus" /LENGTH=654 /DNA_ID=CAMNT_0000988023 /DNA_START=25 /DNA_END=1989 /DNA_ORIENTATION=+ /assembly_acc=CAM_ASM_000156
MDWDSVESDSRGWILSENPPRVLTEDATKFPISPHAQKRLLLKAAESVDGVEIDRLCQICLDKHATEALAMCIVRWSSEFETGDDFHRVLKRVKTFVEKGLEEKSSPDEICGYLALCCGVLSSTSGKLNPLRHLVNQFFRFLDSADADVADLSSACLTLTPHSSQEWKELLEQLRRESEILINERVSLPGHETLRRLLLRRRFSRLVAAITSLLAARYSFTCDVPVYRLVELAASGVAVKDLRPSALTLLCSSLSSISPISSLPAAQKSIDVIQQSLESRDGVGSVELLRASRTVVEAFGLDAERKLITGLRPVCFTIINSRLREKGVSKRDEPARSKKRRKRAGVSDASTGSPSTPPVDNSLWISAVQLLRSLACVGFCGLDPQLDAEIETVASELCRFAKIALNVPGMDRELLQEIQDAALAVVITPRSNMRLPAEFPSVLSSGNAYLQRIGSSSFQCIALQAVKHPRGAPLVRSSAAPQLYQTTIAHTTPAEKEDYAIARVSVDPVAASNEAMFKKENSTQGNQAVEAVVTEGVREASAHSPSVAVSGSVGTDHAAKPGQSEEGDDTPRLKTSSKPIVLAAASKGQPDQSHKESPPEAPKTIGEGSERKEEVHRVGSSESSDDDEPSVEDIVGRVNFEEGPDEADRIGSGE